jgi:UDP-N-acetylglucosamine:LPS N-acetylglucosamine transferase
MSKRDLMKRFKQTVAEKPDTIFFSTHFTPANLASKALPNHKVFLYITDIHPHPIWAIKRRNIIYLVPLEYTKKLLMSYGIAEKNIRVASFPIHPTLIHGVKERYEKRLVNIKKEKTTDILIISGGAGTGLLQMQNLLNTFAAPAHAHKISITFLASTLKLREALKETRLQTGLPKDAVTIDTYKPDTLYKAMRTAEVLITKAGGDITFEALAEGLPVYTLKDVGDHERINRAYMEQMGASRPLESDIYPWELIHHDLLTGKLKEMTTASYKAGEFHRSATIPEILFEEVGWKL